MAETQVTIKNVDQQVFNELKAEAARKKLPVGRALSLAIQTWLSESRKPKLKLLEWETVKGSPKTKYLSEQIDGILYG